MKPILPTLGVLFLLVAPAAAQDSETSYKAAQLEEQAEQGNALAQHHLGLMYRDGRDVPQDGAKAVKWITKAAEQGLRRAQSQLGFMYEEGWGIPSDPIKAAKWYRKAAQQGSPLAQTHLGFMYYEGNGVPQNYVQAHKWFNIAAAHGYGHVTEMRDTSVARHMTPEQIAKAQRLAHEWMEENAE